MDTHTHKQIYRSEETRTQLGNTDKPINNMKLIRINITNHNNISELSDTRVMMENVHYI